MQLTRDICMKWIRTQELLIWNEWAGYTKNLFKLVKPILIKKKKKSSNWKNENKTNKLITYLSIRRSARDRGNLRFLKSAAGIVR